MAAALCPSSDPHTHCSEITEGRVYPRIHPSWRVWKDSVSSRIFVVFLPLWSFFCPGTPGWWSLPWKSPLRSGLQSMELRKELWKLKNSCAASNSLLPCWGFSEIPVMLERSENAEISRVTPGALLSPQSCIDTQQSPCLSHIKSYSADWQWIMFWIMRHDLAQVFSIMEEQ